MLPLPVTVTFWTFELVAGETGSAFHQPKREENTTTSTGKTTTCTYMCTDTNEEYHVMDVCHGRRGDDKFLRRPDAAWKYDHSHLRGTSLCNNRGLIVKPPHLNE